MLLHKPTLISCVVNYILKTFTIHPYSRTQTAFMQGERRKQTLFLAMLMQW